jgi:hypothetical protein
VNLAFDVHVSDPKKLPDIKKWKEALALVAAPVGSAVSLHGKVERAAGQPAQVSVVPSVSAGAVGKAGGQGIKKLCKLPSSGDRG